MSSSSDKTKMQPLFSLITITFWNEQQLGLIILACLWNFSCHLKMMEFSQFLINIYKGKQWYRMPSRDSFTRLLGFIQPFITAETAAAPTAPLVIWALIAFKLYIPKSCCHEQLQFQQEKWWKPLMGCGDLQTTSTNKYKNEPSFHPAQVFASIVSSYCRFTRICWQMCLQLNTEKQKLPCHQLGHRLYWLIFLGQLNVS